MAGNPTQITRFQLHLVIADFHVAKFGQLADSVLNELTEELVQLIIATSSNLVEIGVTRDSAVHIAARHPVHHILNGGHLTSSY